MNNQQIAKLLDLHGIPHYQQGGRIYADSMEAFTAPLENVTDLTGWSRRAILEWLGY